MTRLPTVASDNNTWGTVLNDYLTVAHYANVFNYGAVANDSSGAAITANNTAFTNAAATGSTVYVPPGTFYGTFNLDPTTSPRFVGAATGDSFISIASGQYFIDANRVWDGLHLEKLTFENGAGAVRNRSSSVNVTRLHRILDCDFIDFTVCAVSFNSTDFPFWHIQRATVHAANDTTAIGFAIRGADGSSLQDCSFQKQHVGVKIGAGSGNIHIRNGDFVQDGAASGGNNRMAVWIVPSSSKAGSSGNGCTIETSKFGNEQLGVDDRRIVFADEGAGTHFGDRQPVLSADSTGYVNGVAVDQCLVVGSGIGSHPIVYSTTASYNVEGCSFTRFKLLGAQPSYVVQFRTTTTSPTSDLLSNIVGPVQYLDNNFTPFPASNQLGFAYIDDPTGILGADNSPMPERGGTRATGYVNLLQQRIPSFSLGGATTKTTITDAVGGGDAVEVTFSAGGIYNAVPTSSIKTDMPVWLEFDLKVGSSSSLSSVLFVVKLFSASTGVGNYLRRTLVPPTEWRTYRFPLYIPLADNNTGIDINPGSGATGTKVRIGRVRMYHAQEPVLTDLVLPNVETQTTAPSAGGASALPATPAGYVFVPINGTLRKVPYY